MREVFVQTKKNLETYGWQNDGKMLNHGCLCIEGALALALDIDTIDLNSESTYRFLKYDSHAALHVNHLCDTILEMYPNAAKQYAVETVYRFNDSDDRTLDEIYAVIDRAIETAPE